MISALNIDKKDIDDTLLQELSKVLPLSRNQVETALKTKAELGCSLSSALNRLGYGNEDIIIQAQADILGWSLVDSVLRCPKTADILQLTHAAELSLDWLIENKVFVTESPDSFDVYVVDPYNHFVFVVLAGVLTGKSFHYHLVTSTMLASISEDASRERAVSELFGEQSLNIAALAEEAPVINLVNSFIEKAIQAEASDIHIEAGRQNMVVRFRVDGALIEYIQQPMSRFPAVSSRIKLISELDIAERRLPQDGRFSTRSGAQEFDVRVSTAPDVHGESIVMRLLPKKREELSLANLGFAEDHLAMIKRWGHLPNGIVLVTGPTGSGKSTTLYALLSEVKTGAEKIVTVEDPVEFQLEGITQVQARPDIGYTFAKALRTFLRQDPDVIMVGEIRDKETAEIAVQSSLTGHLVLSTLHTNDACSVFPRLSDIGIESFLTAATIQGVQAQRLVRKLCKHCSQPGPAPSSLPPNIIHNNWRKAVGCKLCQGRGYKGRVGIYELVEVTSGLRTMISDGASVAELRKQASRDGARDLFNDGMLKASQGITSIEEVLRVCNTQGDESDE